ncbi:E3 ubiquitin-protein ligase CCNB1IP1-like protein [Pyrus ussuriensis x Pyrus communis]|uniref:E3 ubiquitin-protein ligase CCNB1IP1-like protein n=1 Tax=Pyrus ussuriensis x Pyrus communis TaxID=2448454 RepID=A0A5N5GS62_9ROSA|nr:E3 ubiquitin-protein ligase CCNB1IP1-like protein [Pyrus ussuriensis x Pyrus communis]
MRWNACWRELEGRAVSTMWPPFVYPVERKIFPRHLCTEDAGKILGSDGACPVCYQVLSKSHMKVFDINPNNEWYGDNGQDNPFTVFLVMKSAHKSVMFYIGQRELEMQYKMNRIQAQYRQKFEAMQEKSGEKMEQLHAAYQKMGKRLGVPRSNPDSLENSTNLKNYQILQNYAS